MHFVTSWDIPNTPNRAVYTAQLEATFGNNSFVKPLTTFYIVRVPSQTEYATILSNLQTIGRTIPGVQLIVSPLMTGGRYDGLHSANVWESINRISD